MLGQVGGKKDVEAKFTVGRRQKSPWCKQVVANNLLTSATTPVIVVTLSDLSTDCINVKPRHQRQRLSNHMCTSSL
jgi:hypothetical protein